MASGVPKPSFPSDSVWRWWNGTLQVWISRIEYDGASGIHFNIHIQPPGGGSDYANYHVKFSKGSRYRWTITDSVGNPAYAIDGDYQVSGSMSAVDAAHQAALQMVAEITRAVGDGNIYGSLLGHWGENSGSLGDLLYGLKEPTLVDSDLVDPAVFGALTTPDIPGIEM
ncbi:MAG TPA: hypothetical protein VKP04_07570 [Ktedonobacteraceae bacterium]|nr:hypothetical protein [Ktedonobacteraceae bacterium]